MFEQICMADHGRWARLGAAVLAVAWREVTLGEYPVFVGAVEKEESQQRVYNVRWISYVDALRALVDPRLSGWRELAGVETEWVQRKLAPVLAAKFGVANAAALVTKALGGEAIGAPPRWWIDNRTKTGTAGEEK